MSAILINVMILLILLKYPFFDEMYTCYTCDHDSYMNETCENDFATIIYDNPCYFDKSYDNPLFIPTIDMHDSEEVCLENL